MERAQFLEQVGLLRAAGKSIRAIAMELDVHRSSVERALKSLRRDLPCHLSTSLDTGRSQDRAGKETFVGRQREMEDLKAALESTLAGYGQLVMLAGEPGIGKTRTAQELSTYATQRGVQVLWGRCHEEQGMPPYWPWIQLIRSYVRGRNADGLRSDMGACAADIAEVVIEVRECLPDLPSPAPLEPQQARFRLFDSTATFLIRVSQTQPLLLVLDNLHWADRSSLLLLEFLAQELAACRVMIVGTYRDAEPTRGHPLDRALGELGRHPHFRRVLLHGLNEEEVGRFIEASAGFTPPQDFLAVVHSQTEGNPLFLTQVIQLLTQEERLIPEAVSQGRAWQFQIPVGVREVIGRRLERLSEKCNRALIVASVIGREFGLDLLERLLAEPATALSIDPERPHSLSSDEVLVAVEEALAARVIEEISQAGNRYQFTHVLIQNTLSHYLSSARRARMHRHIAETLESLYGSGAEAHAAELAHHFMQASPTTDTEKMVHYSRLAGEQALAAYGWEEAQGHFVRGLNTLGALPVEGGPPQDEQTAVLLVGLGKAQAAVSERLHIQESVETLGCALLYYESVHNGDAVLAIAEALPYPVEGLTRTVAVLRRALNLVPPDSIHAGSLWHRLGNGVGMEEGDYATAQECFDRALNVAKVHNDQGLEMRTLVDSASVERRYFHLESSLAKSLQALELAVRSGDLYTEEKARQYASLALAAQGDLAGARGHAAGMVSAANKRNVRHGLGMALAIGTSLARLGGEWRDARALSDRGLEVAPREPNLLALRAMIEYELGEFAAGKEYVQRLVSVMANTAPGPSFEYVVPAIALPLVYRISGEPELLDTAERAAVAALESGPTTDQRLIMAKTGLGLVAVCQGNSARAGEIYGALEQVPQQMFVTGLSSHYHLLGLLARTMGQPDKAAQYFDDALAFCRKAGYRPELAWVCYDYADTLVDPRHYPSSQAALQRAIALLHEATSISTSLGMLPLMERSTVLQQQAISLLRDGGLRRRRTYADGLTEREVEVLRFIVLGKSNQEIAATLLISPNTVVHHVTNILNKTGTANRTEAAAYAIRQGLAT